MATYTDRVEKSVTHYEPGPLPSDPESLGLYTVEELKRLGNVLFNQATFPKAELKKVKRHYISSCEFNKSNSILLNKKNPKTKRDITTQSAIC